MAASRVSARVVLLDEDGAVLLFCGSDPAHTGGDPPRWWFTIGGEAEPGESLAEAAVRELAEETGLVVDPALVTGPVWRRAALIHFNGAVLDSEEFYFLHRTGRFDPSPAGRTPLELRYIHGHRWCDSDDIARLEQAGERVYPLQLSALLDDANRLVGRPADLPPRDIA